MEHGLAVEDRLYALHERLHDGAWSHGPYASLRVCDPKPRHIHKAAIDDRVVHHAIVRVVEPIFDQGFIFDTWSCRTGKGTQAAMFRGHNLLENLARSSRETVWVLQGDIRKYFESVDHDLLKQALFRRIEDKHVRRLLENIIDSFSPGIPLGNFTSQLFANVYLDSFDHFVKEQLGCKTYLRYCDDFLLAHSSRDWLIYCASECEQFLDERLCLTLHPRKLMLRPFHQGIDWLGCVLYPGYRLLRPSTRRRLWKTIDARVRSRLSGSCDDLVFQSTLNSFHGFLKPAWQGDDQERLMVLTRCV